MRLNFTRNLQLGYGFSILILLIVGIVSYNTIDNLLNSNKAVGHSTQVIQKLEQAISLMKDAETGQRGYLLTGKASFLGPYNGAYLKAQGLIDEVSVLTSDNRQQQANLKNISVILTRRMAIIKELVAKKQQMQAISAIDLEEGKSAMDALRLAVDRAENIEHKLLDQRAATLERYTHIAPAVILTAVVLAILIALLSYFNVIRDVQLKDRLQRELQLKEQETAAFNEELTAANEEITTANEELTSINEELFEAQQALSLMNGSLEELVAVRTRSLAESEEETQALNEELTAINEELAASNEEMLASNEELQRSRGEIQKKEHLFRSIAVNIPRSLILVMDKNHNLLTMEGELMQKLGYHAENYAGLHLAEITSPGRYTATKQYYDRMLKGEQIRIELKSTTGDDLQVDYVPLTDDRGAVYAGLVIALDISEQKRAEERSAKLAAIVESSDDAIISKSLDGTITSWNKSAERIFGYPASEMIGQSILKLHPQDRQDEESQIITRLKNGERIEHFETKRLANDGRILDVSLTISPIRDNQGNIIGISKIARDISEQKQDELRKNDFIGMVSHELKTPLTSLMALIQVANLKLKTNTDSFLAGAMEKADIQARRMSSMINGFLNISRLESGKIAIDKELFDLDLLIKEVVEEYGLTVSSHIININICDHVQVNADREKIGSVISNLISNAVKYSPKRKEIEVKCAMVNGFAQISVKDEGMGVDAQDLPRIFDRYYRVESNHTRHISGFGIGLYLSAEIIRRHEGQIWAESESGVGSVFYFSLPLA
ncbi:PAS domain S-box protein [Mucilaginibacter sp. SMC90]|uniref:PAS domain S-box protein n=1 Tax=Mucilaginibacter sp. SMC90 TaxID=2929803 RepID=UPI001FB4318E|nr:PAS domain S-box protein [Mucilaginibacter sp. SMC90]UOE52075.1 PAS domain S-box protein [Mucilaginibacter sp. SMC90]